MKRLMCAGALLLVTGCAVRERPVPPPHIVNAGYGTEFDARNSPRRVRSIPGAQLLAAGSMSLSEYLVSRRVVGGFRENHVVFIDGVQHRGIDALNALPVEQIERIDLLEGLFGGISGVGNAVSVVTKKQ